MAVPLRPARPVRPILQAASTAETQSEIVENYCWRAFKSAHTTCLEISGRVHSNAVKPPWHVLLLCCCVCVAWHAHNGVEWRQCTGAITCCHCNPCMPSAAPQLWASTPYVYIHRHRVLLHTIDKGLLSQPQTHRLSRMPRDFAADAYLYVYASMLLGMS